MNEKFTKLIRGSLKKKEIEELVDTTHEPEHKIFESMFEWKLGSWDSIIEKFKEYGIEKVKLVRDDITKSEIHYLGEYLYTLAVLENLIGVHPVFGVRAYFVHKKILQPLIRIPPKFIKAIIKTHIYKRRRKTV